MNCDEIIELTPEQEKAFKALVRAAKDCKKKGIVFGQVLERIYAWNGRNVERLEVDEKSNELKCFEIGYGAYGFSLECSSFADDQMMHSFRLTPKGEKLLTELSQEESS
jgi:hypothetical protein